MYDRFRKTLQIQIPKQYSQSPRVGHPVAASGVADAVPPDPGH